jgi:hypothetical protein
MFSRTSRLLVVAVLVSTCADLGATKAAAQSAGLGEWLGPRLPAALSPHVTVRLRDGRMLLVGGSERRFDGLHAIRGVELLG